MKPMQRVATLVVALVLGAATAAASPVGVRNVFLNGIDISTAKSQELKNVDVRISDNGDIFLVAPHYQVNEEDTYTPLSKYVKGMSQPVHQAPQKMAAVPRAEPGPAAPAINTSLPPGAAPLSKDGLMPKAGEPMPVAKVDAPPSKEAPAAREAPAAGVGAITPTGGTVAAPPPLPIGDEGGSEEPVGGSEGPARADP